MGRRVVMNRRWAWVVAFAPSVSLGVVGGVAWWLAPPDLTPRVGLVPSMAAGLGLAGGLLLAAAWLERHLASFRFVTRRTEWALRRLAPSRGTAMALTLVTSLGEEILFRGVLLHAFGLVPQAIVFGLLHPAGRRGWSYPVFTAVSGLALGALVLWTGRLAPAVLAHVVINGVGFVTARQPRRPVSM